MLKRLRFVGSTQIDTDEEVVFFPTYAFWNERRGTWLVNLHGWIFESNRDSGVRRLLMRMMLRYLRLSKKEVEDALLDGRAKAFLVVNERGKTISIRMGDRVHLLSKSRRNGHFHGKLELNREELSYLLKHHPAERGRLGFQAITRPEDPRSFDGIVHVVEESGISVISDIDDTIKISDVPNRRALLTNTFVHEFQAVPGMAETYRRLAESGAVFHYVSSSPWQLYRPLAGFMQTEGFPAGAFHLRNLRFQGATLGELFSTRGRSKRRLIERLFRHFPRRKFILVGDSGERDPHIYAKVAKRFADQIALICIRQVAGVKLNSDRYTKLTRRLADKWHFFADPQEFQDRLLPLIRAQQPSEMEFSP